MNVKGKLIIGLVIAGAALAIACGSGGSGDNGTNPTADRAPLVINSASVAAPDPNAIADDGVFQVGGQVQPGTYKTIVPDGSILCSYQRLKGVSGDAGDIIAINVASANDSVMVTIKKTDAYFKTDGCGRWTKISA